MTGPGSAERRQCSERAENRAGPDSAPSLQIARKSGCGEGGRETPREVRVRDRQREEEKDRGREAGEGVGEV